MLEIAGGIYREYCVYPEWDEIFGSGLRAASSLSKCCTNGIRLSAFVPEDQQGNIKTIVSSWGVDSIFTPTESMITFSYFHGLSVPYINPNPIEFLRNKELRVKGKAVLRFGFIEGSAVVSGDRVVYDPQSSILPIPFAENGSQAKELALVLNYREAMVLVGSGGTPYELGLALKKKEGAEIVVIKLGAKGCVVIDKDNVATPVPVYETNFVWKIGSGDIFSAFFAYGWAELKLTPIEACYLASKAAAFYCGQRFLPIPIEFDKLNEFRPIVVKEKEGQKKKKVYLAGPFFNMGQRWLIEEARGALLGSDIDVFSPLHEVGSGSAKEIYDPDIAGLQASDVILACLDGLDAGTIYEIGYAKAQGKPVIVYVGAEPPESLKMIEGSGCIMTDDFTTAIYKTIWAAMSI